MNALELIGIHKTFGDKAVLRGVDLAVRPGEVMFIVGTSGVGKSVAIKHVIGLLRADAGEIRVFGERVDQLSFDGLIIQRIRERIETAKVVIADLSTANPNVYLEVGYAWGRNKPTILLVRDVSELRFDVQGYRCLIYRSIRELEALLSAELARGV